MRLLVTRPRPDAEAQAERLAALGHEAIISPLLKVEFLDPGPLPLEGAQALITTSGNALRALEHSGQSGQAFSLPLFAVGAATAALAREMGFERVTTGEGSAESLVPVIASACTPEAGPVVHLAGESLAWDLKAALENEGFTVHQPVVYRTVAATDFTAEAASALEAGTLDGVILMSPLSAGTYAGLVHARELGDQAAQLVNYCLSAKVARALEGLEGAEVRVPDTPSQEDLLALIGRDAAN